MNASTPKFNRRKFLTYASLASASGLMSTSAHFKIEAKAQSSGRPKKMVVIFLRGALDGLNTVVPFREANYYVARPTIAIPGPGKPNGAINLDGQFGLHPALSDLMPFWQSRQLAFIHASGSPIASRSHFDAQDFMESGTPGDKATSTGWMNRLLAFTPNQSATQAINLGSSTPRILAGPRSTSNVVPNNKGLPNLAIDREPVQSIFDQLYQGNNELARVYKEGVQSRERLRAGLNQEMMSSANGAPTPDYLSKNISNIVKLLSGPTETKIMFMSLGGWDTHVNQGGSSGQLANRLKPLGQGLSMLAKSLGNDLESTIIVVMSEFGRTFRENGNGGTDHGHGNVMMVLGGPITGGQVYGEWPGLQEEFLHEGRELAVTTDFRDVYTSLLSRHYQLNSTAIAQIFPRYQSQNPIQLI
jgi:uncharacterized protein (DUF1501 family)